MTYQTEVHVHVNSVNETRQSKVHAYCTLEHYRHMYAHCTLAPGPPSTLCLASSGGGRPGPEAGSPSGERPSPPPAAAHGQEREHVQWMYVLISGTCSKPSVPVSHVDMYTHNYTNFRFIGNHTPTCSEFASIKENRACHATGIYCTFTYK